MESTIPSSYRKWIIGLIICTCWSEFLYSSPLLCVAFDVFWSIDDCSRPCGAFMMLLYGLTPAPSAQPTNAMIGQAMSMTIGMSISYMRFLPVWLRQSLGTSLAISAMVKQGILHPPAGKKWYSNRVELAVSARNEWLKLCSTGYPDTVPFSHPLSCRCYSNDIF